jgi:hypothetical protein
MSIRRSSRAVSQPLLFRRVGLLVLTAFAAAALGPLLTALLDRLAPGDQYRTGSAAAQSSAFLETFDGNPSSPQRFQSPNWQVDLTGNRTEANLILP